MVAASPSRGLVAAWIGLPICPLLEGPVTIRACAERHETDTREARFSKRRRGGGMEGGLLVAVRVRPPPSAVPASRVLAMGRTHTRLATIRVGADHAPCMRTPHPRPPPSSPLCWCAGSTNGAHGAAHLWPAAGRLRGRHNPSVLQVTSTRPLSACHPSLHKVCPGCRPGRARGACPQQIGESGRTAVSPWCAHRHAAVAGICHRHKAVAAWPCGTGAE